MESGGDTDMRVAKNPLKLLPGILGSEIGDRVATVRPDPIEFYKANPFNIPHLVDSAYRAAYALYYDDDLSDEDYTALVYAGLWHAPVWAAHIAHKMGAFAGYTGGFGYYRSLSMLPMGGLALAATTSAQYQSRVWKEIGDPMTGAVHYSGAGTMSGGSMPVVLELPTWRDVENWWESL